MLLGLNGLWTEINRSNCHVLFLVKVQLILVTIWTFQIVAFGWCTTTPFWWVMHHSLHLNYSFSDIVDALQHVKLWVDFSLSMHHYYLLWQDWTWAVFGSLTTSLLNPKIIYIFIEQLYLILIDFRIKYNMILESKLMVCPSYDIYSGTYTYLPSPHVAARLYVPQTKPNILNS